MEHINPLETTIKRGQRCPRCGFGMILSDLSCYACGADYLPIQPYELYREHKEDPDFYHPVPLGDWNTLRKGLTNGKRLPRTNEKG